VVPTELLAHAEVVAVGPVLSNSAFFHAEPVGLDDREGPAARREYCRAPAFATITPAGRAAFRAAAPTHLRLIKNMWSSTSPTTSWYTLLNSSSASQQCPSPTMRAETAPFAAPATASRLCRRGDRAGYRPAIGTFRAASSSTSTRCRQYGGSQWSLFASHAVAISIKVPCISRLTEMNRSLTSSAYCRAVPVIGCF
jgi:hypothetical protein